MLLTPSLLRPHSLARIAPLITYRAMSSTSEPLILTSRSPSNHVAILTLNRPKALNALSSPLFAELNAELLKADDDESVRAIVVTGGEKVFAAGADIKEMKDKECEQGHHGRWLRSSLRGVQGEFLGDVEPHQRNAETYHRRCERLCCGSNSVVKQQTAAESQLGGGCELAMLTDILLCSEKASFGQPEINLGIIPGSGGTQRLTHLIGKARAMDMVLTGRRISGSINLGVHVSCADSKARKQGHSGSYRGSYRRVNLSSKKRSKSGTRSRV